MKVANWWIVAVQFFWDSDLLKVWGLLKEHSRHKYYVMTQLANGAFNVIETDISWQPTCDLTNNNVSHISNWYWGAVTESWEISTFTYTCTSLIRARFSALPSGIWTLKTRAHGLIDGKNHAYMFISWQVHNTQHRHYVHTLHDHGWQCQV